MDNRSKAAELIRTAKHLVALTGAGISKESNVPTFRGKDVSGGKLLFLDRR